MPPPLHPQVPASMRHFLAAHGANQNPTDPVLDMAGSFTVNRASGMADDLEMEFQVCK